MPLRSSPAWLALVVTLGCGGNEFQGDGGESGQGGTAGAPGGSGPTGGTAGMAGGGSGGMAGSPTGGTGGMPCSCAPTEYCRGGVCLACSELATLDFGEPELVLDDPAASLRFPRSGDVASSLFYRVGAEGSGRTFYTSNATTLGRFVGNPDIAQQSGALFVGDLDPNFNVIFDQSIDGGRTARTAVWNGTTLGSEGPMPPPLSASNFETYSLAAATATGRLFWMSNRDGPLAIRSGIIDTGDGDTIVNIVVPTRSGSGECMRDPGDATPWVTPDGRRMFFRALPLDDDCQPADATTTDLFVVPLVPMTGAPTQPAVALSTLNEVGTTETDPSLSADFCTLYFASDRGSAGGSDFKLYRAPRR